MDNFSPKHALSFVFGGKLLALSAVLLASAAGAAPVTYSGFTITDGQLGTWAFHNARVYLTFHGDTNNVQFIQPPDPFNPGGSIDAYVNTVGTASVTIISGRKRVHATFAPNQILISLDLGNTGDPHVGGRGVGFSSFTSTGIEPAYPLGIEDGTIDWGDITPPGVASPALAALSTDLQHSTVYSGRGWSCVGFPDTCTAPNALQTDRGALLLYTPYSYGAPAGGGNDSLTAGFFIVEVGKKEHDHDGYDEDDLDDDNGVPELQSRGFRCKSPITYYGYTIADVILGHHHYPAAQVYLTYDAETSAVVPFNADPSFYGFINEGGNARVTVVSGRHVVSADFAPGQIYVYYDVGGASVGFGSGAGGTGYPLSITANADYNGLVENSLVGAVTDLTVTPAHAASYSAETATLATDLTNATLLAGAASSCIAFDPATSACSNFTPAPLHTSRGPFLMFEPYTDDETANLVPGPYSINWGLFWSELGSRRGDHRRGDDRE
jgi:hypothetical protein